VATDLPGPLICERHTLHGIMSGMVETQAVGLLSIKTGDATETVECWATTKKLSLSRVHARTSLFFAKPLSTPPLRKPGEFYE
jgi:hypothetical protein